MARNVFKMIQKPNEILSLINFFTHGYLSWKEDLKAKWRPVQIDVPLQFNRLSRSVQKVDGKYSLLSKCIQKHNEIFIKNRLWHFPLLIDVHIVFRKNIFVLKHDQVLYTVHVPVVKKQKCVKLFLG